MKKFVSGRLRMVLPEVLPCGLAPLRSGTAWGDQSILIHLVSITFGNHRLAVIVLSSSTTRTRKIKTARNIHRRTCMQIRTGHLSPSFWQWDVTCVSIKIGMTEGVIRFFESRVGM